MALDRHAGSAQLPGELGGGSVVAGPDAGGHDDDRPITRLPGPDLPGPDLPGPDLPGPDLPCPDMPGPDMPRRGLRGHGPTEQGPVRWRCTVAAAMTLLLLTECY
ncbi:hypothetical protein Pme01_05050 [Planosporangium mesophilum]|uniref:Uncharacterized protein n=1 Tax=Planosporangium mesophilum TaxID=689768 RepID=A0A8J3T627_9ACTN|nr:hypothetical protein Pme01_05050 [Planosporangium mesophilum]